MHFVVENVCIWILILLKFVPTDIELIDKTALVQEMARHQTGDKVLFESVMNNLLKH